MIHIVVHMHHVVIMPNETSSGTGIKHATLAEMYRRKREGRARWLTTFALSATGYWQVATSRRSSAGYGPVTTFLCSSADYGQVDHLSRFQRRLWAG
jgi:hypothetical protein